MMFPWLGTLLQRTASFWARPAHVSRILLLATSCLPFTLQAETDQLLKPDSMEARVAACTHCHGAQGRAGPDGFYPRIAGKPAGYLLAQLVSFRDGGRNYEPMRHLLEGLSDNYLAEIAGHFADIHLPYSRPAPASTPTAQLEQGRALVVSGDRSRDLPACISCHGSALAGVEPHIPGLLGLSRDYIAAQLGSWRIGLRQAASPDCMAEVSHRLSPADIAAISAWLAAQPVAEPYRPEPAGSFSLPMECGVHSTQTLLPPALPEAAGTAMANETLELGRYLAKAANCATCHTRKGGEPLAGAAAITTPFGTLYGPNITPSTSHGIGKWTADDFWNALHHGKAPDGTPYYPAFPYPQYTHITREDSDALFAYLMAQPAVETPNRPHELRFPYNQRGLLQLWRSLYFTPGALPDDASRDSLWHRGRYLVEGAGHCAACHTPRNRWAANQPRLNLQGSAMMGSHWYATALTGGSDGLGKWSEEDIMQLLRTGSSAQGTAAGPMAEVVSGSTQYLSEHDLQAMASYLKSLPATETARPVASPPEIVMNAGGRLYEQHCVNCHRASGQGSPPAWPPLAGNTSVLAASPDNILHIILKGGYAPLTAGNPRPHGMPPYHGLSDSDIAALATYIRNSWGNRAGAVSAHQVTPLR